MLLKTTLDATRDITTVARKELAELRRQPGVLLLVVLGPFLVLAAFGAGYRNEELALRTVFVGPIDGAYEAAIDRYASSIEDYVVPLAFTSDLFAATEDLKDGRTDLVIVLPPDPGAAIAENERSEIAVLHDSIDPIQQIGIEFATEVAVRELNATVVTASLQTLLTEARSIDREVGRLGPEIDALDAAVERDDPVGTALAARSLSERIEGIAPSLDLVVAPEAGSIREGGTDENESGDNESGENSGLGSASGELLISRLDRIEKDPSSAGKGDVDAVRAHVEGIDERVGLLLGLEADVLSRPFVGDAESLVRARVSAEDHVAPGATALLIQHLGVSLAALSLVRDERRGVLSSLRVGPTSVVSVMMGKLTALSLVSLLGAVVIVAGQVQLLGVPLRGSVALLGLILVGLTVSSVALGLVLASLGRTELYASQAAMITLLLALFFSGFLLDLDRVRAPLSYLGLIVPSTPAVEALRDIQLRGDAPTAAVWLILAVQTGAGLVVASALVARRWRTLR